jgi:hypothetical protein
VVAPSCCRKAAEENHENPFIFLLSNSGEGPIERNHKVNSLRWCLLS